VAVDGAAPAGTRRAGVVASIGIVVGAYAVLASMTKPNTLPALLAVLLPAAVVTACAFRKPPSAVHPSVRLRRTTVLWVSVVVVGLVWEVGALIGEHTVGQHQFPTLSALTEPALENPIVRFAAWVGWLLAGWRLARR
jgi:hypothetical protein